MTQLIPLKSAADKLCISTRQLRRRMAAGEIKFYKSPGQNGKVTFSETQITDYLKTYCSL